MVRTLSTKPLKYLLLFDVKIKAMKKLQKSSSSIVVIVLAECHLRNELTKTFNVICDV